MDWMARETGAGPGDWNSAMANPENQCTWEFTAHLFATGTRWGWTRINAASCGCAESHLTFGSCNEAMANAAYFGFDRRKDKFVMTAVEANLSRRRYPLLPRVPLWPQGVAVV